MTLDYMTGFNNDFASEALDGALPVGQNSPQKCPYGLYAEQLSGSPFTAPGSSNERSWLYRILPSVKHSGLFEKTELPFWKTAPDTDDHHVPLTQLRWDAVPIPQQITGFINGIRTITTAGDARSQSGMATHIYFASASMEDEYFYNADGEMLIIPQSGELRFCTEFGIIEVEPGEICVIPRGVKFRVELIAGSSRGYICENYGAKFGLPGRGPIGANCLANPRDFNTPVAAFEDQQKKCQLVVKWGGDFHRVTLDQSPLDVVAWHGNYAPYKYDLRNFSPVGAILFDHPDPSIFTVLTAPTAEQGTANVDFLIFPERWLVAENSFRPPWYHMNIMSEFMGLIYGTYDAKKKGFAPGAMSLHNMMLPHGPDAMSFDRGSDMELKPQKLTNTMAFMLETHLPQRVSRYAIELDVLQNDYLDCWKDLKRNFDGNR